MLERMRRRHSREHYLGLIQSLREARPEIALSTDIIVGFPGETDEEHRQTLSLLEEVRYDFIYSFKYSPRPFTPAVRKMEDDVPHATKKARLTEIQATQRAITNEVLRKWVGTECSVLVEGPAKRDVGSLSGRISQNWIVNFEGTEQLIGQTVAVGIEQAFPNCLAGSLPTRETVGRRLAVLT